MIPASIYFVRWFKLHRRLRREQWQKTEGKVVDSRVVRFITPSYYPIIEYNASGVTRRFVSKHSGASETIGEKVDVFIYRIFVTQGNKVTLLTNNTIREEAVVI